MSSSAGGGGTSTSTGTGPRSAAGRLGISDGMVVMEIGYDEGGDEQLRSQVAQATGADLVDEDSDEVVDAVLIWYRADDGDLVDILVDALGPLADNGVVWVLTPKQCRDGHVAAGDISEAAPTAGLMQTSSISASRDWSGVRLVPPRTSGRR